MRIKKKNQKGSARVFIPRKKALKKLQLSLKDFRRLCILKGIYPREPLHIKKANKGSTENRIFYHLRDINHLANEPLLNEFRKYKVFLRKINKAKAKHDDFKVKSLVESKPVFSLDHLIKERYPTFPMALRDLDDALCLCFAFSALTRSKIARPKAIDECRRLSVEFMHYVIEANALSKVFVSIKGIYYQAEIMGERVTWMVGHERSVGRANELDFSVMANFVDFYLKMLEFVNFRLYKSIGLYYPPKLQSTPFKSESEYNFETSEEDDKVYSLAFPIERVNKTEPEVTIDTFEETGGPDGLAEKIQQAQKLKTLFSGCRFFLNREVPREHLAFVVRSCGGTVSWEDLPNGLVESNNFITHQIVDRNVQNININRIYIQPQWIFDCFNARRLLPTLKYAPGAKLPPHLSPFVEEHISDYVPLERIEQLREEGKDVSNLLGMDEPAATSSTKKNKKPNENEPPTMRVKTAKPYKENKQKKINEKGHDLKLKEMMISKKHRRVYQKIKFGIKRKAKEANKLTQKRKKLAESSS